jgi:hypothetical protein
VELRALPVSFPTKKRLCYLVEGLRGVVEVRRAEDIPASRAFAESRGLPHTEVFVNDLGPVLAVARTPTDLAADVRLREEWNGLARDPEEIGRDLARLSFRIPGKAIDAFGHAAPRHLEHGGHRTQEVLDFQPCGLAESEVRREMERRLRALAKHRLL